MLFRKKLIMLFKKVNGSCSCVSGSCARKKMAAVVSGSCTVCVTGGSGYMASSLIGKLLRNGYTVHATLRNPNDESKVGVLKSLPNATTNLVLFRADIYDPDQFEAAIRGCQIVFHVATPLQHTPGTQYKNMTEASVAAAKKIAKFCVESRTVKRLIYTGSMVATSPMKDDGSGFKDFLDETCWTPLNLSYHFSNSSLKKELLEFGESEESGELEVVSLVCGLTSDDTSAAMTTIVTFSQFTDQTAAFDTLRFLEEVIGKVPLVHLHDVCDAHIFCMEQPSIHGRFLCASSFWSSRDIANYYRLHHPQLQQIHGNSDDVPMRNIKMNSSKLIDRGFVYKYDGDMILEHAFNCCKKEMFVERIKLG